jgi:WD40 repeat protein
VGHTTLVASVAFAPDGRSAFSVSADGTIIQWHTAQWSVDELAAWAKDNRYRRDLTCDERTLYRIEPLCPQSPSP